MKILSAIIILFFAFLYKTQNNIPSFGERTELGEIQNDYIDEASGLVASLKNKGVLWTHNDSGCENRIILIIDESTLKRVCMSLRGVLCRGNL